ncbi:MAG TPA: cation:proton antiporter [Longimicrobiales bacterium]|nr:cation:proton antiporter [Longimicrobiales bacterium]
MNPLVGVLVLVLLGLLGARFAFNEARVPLGPRLLVSAGTHFIFLGFLLGVNGFGLLTPRVLDQLYPFMALGLGWIGLLFGIQLDRRQLAFFPPAFLLVALIQALVAFAVFLLVGTGIAAFLADTPGLTLALLITAATACVSTPAGVALISRSFQVRGPVSQLTFFIASVDAAVGIAALQVAYAFRHPSSDGTFAAGGWEWIAVALAAGIVFGVFFLWLTRPKPSREELTLFLLGLVVFAAGAALYLGVSPLFVTMVAGIVIANLSPARRRVFRLLQAWEQPVYVILLILAGALLRFPTWLILPLAAAYVVLRGLGKLAGGWLAVRVTQRGFRPPADLGLGLLPQGGISLAMVISITLTYGAIETAGFPLVDVLFSTVVLAVVASELIGPLLTRDMFRRAGELTPRPDR